MRPAPQVLACWTAAPVIDQWHAGMERAALNVRAKNPSGTLWWVRAGVFVLGLLAGAILTKLQVRGD